MKKAIAWAFPKKSPYLHIFNFYIQKFKGNGIWKSIEERHNKPSQVCPDLSGKPIAFESCFTAFLALLVGMILSILIILIEFQKSKLSKTILGPNDDSNGGQCSKIPSNVQNEIEDKIKSYYDIIANLKLQLQNIKQHNDNLD